MAFPQYDTESLARMRMQECQGTMIGAALVAARAGLPVEEFGYRMMMDQGIRWERIQGDLEKIGYVFYEHYQTTYGFGEALHVELTEERLVFSMPPLAQVAAGQLEHWKTGAETLHDLQRGYWRSLTENAGVAVELEFGDDADRVTVTRRSG
ncbi:MAG: hypothetical protein VX663_08220 [Pseudomonadota bacterium]|nr:hypothetical protein [Pseudomonadota bacterium]